MYRASFFLKLVIITIIISIPIGCSKTHKGDTYLPKNQKPNIVLIVIDALRSDKLGCYGFNKNTSPEIDKIAEMSIVFKDVYSQCSWTRPSIGSLITSLYPRSLGIFKEKFDTLDDKFITLAEILKDNGYFTMGFTANPNINSVFNFDQGFDFYSDSNAVWEWMNRKKGEIFASKKGRSFLPKSQPLFNSIIEKVKENLKKPFYLQINVMEVHTPALMRKEYKVMALNKVKKHSKNFRNKRLLQKVVNYETAIQQISFDLDVFISRLKKTLKDKNTLIIITSDHGEGLDNHPNLKRSSGHGNYLYKSMVKVPLIFYNLNNKLNTFKPKKINTPVRSLDLMPTILDYLKIPIPDFIHGRSLLNLFLNNEIGKTKTEYFFVETAWREIDKIGVYSKDWEFFINRDKIRNLDPEELQFIDKIEHGNRSNKVDKYPAIAKKLKRILNRWRKKYPRQKRVSSKKELSDKEIDQLKTLGYL